MKINWKEIKKSVEEFFDRVLDMLVGNTAERGNVVIYDKEFSNANLFFEKTEEKRPFYVSFNGRC
ncbi:MAG: hypothetical protein JST26_12930 [Bacteroidetes bacterium]|nr:hypothetical protein [Bacteroidota bacterium]